MALGQVVGHLEEELDRDIELGGPSTVLVQCMGLEPVQPYSSVPVDIVSTSQRCKVGNTYS